MNLISKKLLFGYSILAIISGLTSFIFIKYINEVIGFLIDSELPKDNKYHLIFTSIIILFFISRLFLSQGVVKISQDLYWNMRKDIIRLVLNGRYRRITVLEDEVQAALTADVNNITNASFITINFISSIILVFACFIYMALLSKILCIMSFFAFVVGSIIYYFNSKLGAAQFKKVRHLENSFASIFNSILKGIKEIKVNPLIGENIFSQKLVPVVNNGMKYSKKAHLTFLTSQMITNVVFYLLIMFVLLYSANVFRIEVNVIINYIVVLLFMLGPLVNIMVSLPSINKAVISYNRLVKLKEELNGMNDISDSSKLELPKMETLIFKEYSFAYGKNKFSIGPIELDIAKNELIFIFGGNGSGKSTLIKLLLNLYEKNSGWVLLNNVPTKGDKVNQIHEYFSPVFSDFFVHNDLFGMVKPDIRAFEKYLKLLEIDHKVSMVNGKYSTTNLSTGQMKRLALINAVMEGRPILILDEWAADQDPYFRYKFYTKILPLIIKDEDKTIIAITHDDKYYHLADRIFKMESGQLNEVERVK